MKKVRDRAADQAEEKVLDLLLPAPHAVNFEDMQPANNATRQKFRKMLREGALDDKEIEVEVSAAPGQMEIFGPPGMEELTQQIQGMFHNMGGGKKKITPRHGRRGDAAADRGRSRADDQRR